MTWFNKVKITKMLLDICSRDEIYEVTAIAYYSGSQTAVCVPLVLLGPFQGHLQL